MPMTTEPEDREVVFVRLSPKDKRKLKARAKAERRTMSAVVECALEQYYANENGSTKHA